MSGKPPFTEIEFHGCIATGVGRHNELGIPGRSQLSAAPSDWPDKLYPGSLNVELFPDRLPAVFKEHGLPTSVVSLDAGFFEPELEIPHNQIAANTIGRDRGPRGGDAQVWRAYVYSDNRRIEMPQCWVLRRFGSRVRERLELVAGSRLRDIPGIVNGRIVMVRMLGRWRA